MIPDVCSEESVATAVVGEASAASGAGSSISPLRVTALVVGKADLVGALRIYVPQLTDVIPMDGERFLLSLIPTTFDENESTGGRNV